MNTYSVRVSCWAYVEQFIEVEAESEEEAIKQVEDEQLWEYHSWQYFESPDITDIEVST